jgi:hypothetical protein
MASCSSYEVTIVELHQMCYRRASPNGFCCEPLRPPPKPPKPLPTADDASEPKPLPATDDASEPNPPPWDADPNPLDVPNPPDLEAPPNKEVFPMGAGDPKVTAPVDGVVAGCDATTPNIDGSRLYFLARLRNNCSSRPAYLFSNVSTSSSLLGLCF